MLSVVIKCVTMIVLDLLGMLLRTLISVTRLGNLLDFGQLFEAFANN